MPVREGREYRSAPTFDAVPPSDEEQNYIVEGYATTFDAPYDFGRGGMKEQILRSALDGADMSDVIFQMNHEGSPLARQRNGSLTVDNDEHGMHVKAYLGGSEAGRNLYEAIQNGLIDRMSWGFTIDDDGWDYDESTHTSTISKVDKVFDVSAVSIPANEDTSIQARSYFDGVIEGEEQELLMRHKDADMRRRIGIRLSLGKER